MDIEVIDNPEKEYPYELITEQLSDEWFKSRMGRITGSLFKKLKPLKKQITDADKKGEAIGWNEAQLKVLREIACEILTGEAEETFSSAAMQWGNDHEPLAKKHYELDTMTTVRDCGIYLISDYLASSPDGIVGDNEKILEIKCPNSKQHLRYMLNPIELFKDYDWQCYGEMYGTGINQGDICSYDPRFPYEKRLVKYSFVADVDEMEMVKTRLDSAVELIKGWVK